MFGFQKLEIYHLSKDLVLYTYSITEKFTSRERFALVQQMNRSVVSISSNIAEGCSRITSKEKIRFINIAYGSLMELVCQYEIAFELKYVTQSQFEHFLKEARNLSVKLSNFRRTLEK